MNIYQNGEFSKNLHKLTKYQSLAATVNDMSKQSLYAQKIQEYKNKLDKIGSVQTGGLTTAQQTKVDEVVIRVRNELVPKEYKEAFIKLQQSHQKLLGEINQISTQIQSLIDEKDAIERQKREVATQFDQKVRELAAKDKRIAGLLTQIEGYAARIGELRAQLAGRGLTKEERARLLEQLAAAETAAGQARIEAAANNPELQAQQASLIGSLNARIAELTAQLAQAQNNIGDTSSGSAVCDAAIQDILTQIDSAITGKMTDKPDTTINNLSQFAQNVLDKLSGIGSS
jgi:chromosome segregation ATPase